jgi:hypothetical protein
MALFGRSSEPDEARAEAWRDWLQRRNPYAIASLVLGIFSLIEFGVLLIFGVAGIALGAVALVQLNRPVPPNVESPPRDRGQRLAWTGIALSILSLAIAAYLYQLR